MGKEKKIIKGGVDFSATNPMGDGRFKFFYACLEKGLNSEEKCRELYKSGMSCCEVREWLLNNHQINVSEKRVREIIGNKIRTHSESKLNAIKRGRMIYRKTVKKEKLIDGYVSDEKKIKALLKSNFSCSLCGRKRSEGWGLEIHKKDFDNENKSEDNLRVLCGECHTGLHAMEREKTTNALVA